MPLDQNVADYIHQEAEKVISIYTRLYPSRELRFVFREGKNPIFGEAFVTEGKAALHPSQLGADYLGQMIVPGPKGDGLSVTVTSVIPRLPLPNEYQQTVAPWAPQRPLKPVFRLFPMLYEQIRYLAEMRRKKRSNGRHMITALPLGKGSGLFSAPEAPANDKGRLS